MKYAMLKVFVLQHFLKFFALYILALTRHPKVAMHNKYLIVLT